MVVSVIPNGYFRDTQWENIISQICGILVLVAMALPVILFIGVGVMCYFAQNH
jgi:hypothetical protein